LNSQQVSELKTKIEGKNKQNVGLEVTAIVVTIYIAAFLSFILYQVDINIFLYSTLGIASLLAFFSIVLAMFGYIGYNLYIFGREIFRKYP
jgi:hypothetical protein